MVNINELFGLNGKLAVISGGAGLIGSKICEVLASAGSNLIILDMIDTGENLAKSLSDNYKILAEYKKIDITNEEEIKELRRYIKEKFGQCDILINSAHYKKGGFFSRLSEYPTESWKKVIDVNLTGTFLLCREIGSLMYEGTGGTIVNIGSTYGIVSADPRIYGSSGINSPISYAATKSSILNLTRYIAIHWSPKVRVNTLIPGGVEAGQDPEFIKNYCYRTPLGRMAKAEDYQGAILFMCSDASKYMTGATVTVDGGWTAW